MSSRKVMVIRNGREGDGHWLVSTEPGEPGEPEGIVSSSPASLEDLLGRRRPDVIVLDLGIPIRHGVEVLRTVTSACPEAEVMTRIDSPTVEPKFFSVRSSPSGLSLEPLDAEDLQKLPAGLRSWKLAV